jgi:hypothetical protein
MAVQQSRCGRFAAAYFRHNSAGGYIFEVNIEMFDTEL